MVNSNWTTYDIHDLENIINSIPYPILAKDNNNICIYANNEFLKLFHIDRKDIIGNDIFNCIDLPNNKLFPQNTDSNNHYSKLFEIEIIYNEKKRYFEVSEHTLKKNNDSSEYSLYLYKDITLIRSINNTLKMDLIENIENFILVNNKTKELLSNNLIENNLLYEQLLNSIFNNEIFKERMEKILVSFSDILHSMKIHIFLYNPITNHLNLYIDSNKFFKKSIPISNSYKLNKNIENYFLNSISCNKIQKLDEKNFFYNKNSNNMDSNIYIKSFPIQYNSTLLGIINIYYADDYKFFVQQQIIEKICSNINFTFIHKIIFNEFKTLIDIHTCFEEQLQLFLETATDLWAIIDSNGYFKYINNTFKSNLGWTLSELKSIKYQDLIHPDDYENSSKIHEKAYENSNYKDFGLINRYKCKNGTYIYFEWNWYYIKSNNSVILTGKNISEKLMLQQEKLKLEKNISIENMKSNFFANISHEFKTPLNIILLTLQLMTQSFEKCNSSSSDDKMLKYSTILRQNSYRLLKLVNNLIDLNKIDQGYLKLNLKQCNLVNIIEEIVISVADHIGNKNRTIIFDTTEEEVIGYCDPDKIESILLNLLSNAVKFTHINGLIQVNLSLDKNRDNLIVSVKDDGVAIKKEHSKLIFDRFTQTANLINRPCEGSGLGLAIVKSLVTLHKGNIWVNTDFKDGAEIIFTLPLMKYHNEKSNTNILGTLDSNIELYNIEFSDIYNI